MLKIRKPFVSDQFYPSSKIELKRQIETFLKNAKNFQILPKCIIVPHAGYMYSGQVAAFGYKQFLNLPNKKWKIILLGPSHYYSFNGAAYSEFDIWETPLGKVKTIKPKISNQIFEFTEAHIPEHCLEVQIPFLQYALKEFEIIPLLLGEIKPKLLAKELTSYLSENTLLIISSDLSHYYNYKRALEIDSLSNKLICAMDLKNAQKINACGKNAILTALYLAHINKWNCLFLNYANSGDITLDKSKVVGYGAFAFY